MATEETKAVNPEDCIWIKWSEDQKKIYADWVAERPEVIREMMDKYNLRPDCLYLLKTSNKRVILHSLNEDGTVMVHILSQFNPEPSIIPFMERSVFGIKPENLELCPWDGDIEDGANYDE